MLRTHEHPVIVSRMDVAASLEEYYCGESLSWGASECYNSGGVLRWGSGSPMGVLRVDELKLQGK